MEKKMAKIIVSCRFQKSAKDIADLIRYMATREGVEKLPDTKKYNIAKQAPLFCRVSPSVRFVDESRVKTQPIYLRSVGDFWTCLIFCDANQR